LVFPSPPGPPRRRVCAFLILASGPRVSSASFRKASQPFFYCFLHTPTNYNPHAPADSVWPSLFVSVRSAIAVFVFHARLLVHFSLLRKSNPSGYTKPRVLFLVDPARPTLKLFSKTFFPLCPPFFYRVDSVLVFFFFCMASPVVLELTPLSRYGKRLPFSVTSTLSWSFLSLRVLYLYGDWFSYSFTLRSPV